MTQTSTRTTPETPSHTLYAGFTRSDWLIIALCATTLIPFILTVFFHVGAGSPIVVAIVTGISIVAAAFFLSWATEALQTVLPQSVALAILALIEVAPEYSFEFVLAYRQQTELASASMTGANRLLLGLGWPLIMFIAYFSAKRRGQSFKEITLDIRNVPEIFSLMLATIYAFVMVAKRSFSLIDSIVLIAIYIIYMILAFRSNKVHKQTQSAERLKQEENEEERADFGVASRTKKLPGLPRTLAATLFLAIGAFVLVFGAELFVDSVLNIGRSLKLSEFILIQWIAPFLSEFPESLTAFIWAGMIIYAGRGMSNMISSKVNQWTLLIATIPLAFSLGAGHLGAVHLNEQAVDEVFLTAAQSVLGMAILLTLRFNLWHAIALVVLFFLQFFITVESVRVIVGWLYIVLSVIFLIWQRKNLRLPAALYTLLTGKTHEQKS